VEKAIGRVVALQDKGWSFGKEGWLGFCGFAFASEEIGLTVLALFLKTRKLESGGLCSDLGKKEEVAEDKGEMPVESMKEKVLDRGDHPQTVFVRSASL
jgi:hypothetical protein